MTKRIIVRFLILAAMAALLIVLGSCSSHGIRISVDLDEKTLTISANNDALSANAESILSQHEDITFVQGTSLSKIIIDISDQDGTSTSHSDIMNAVASAIPVYAGDLNGLSLFIERNFFGTSMFGTEYYSLHITSPMSFTIPFEVCRSGEFMFDGREGVLNSRTGKYVVSTNLSLRQGENTYEMQYHIRDYQEISIEVDITDGTPMITYRISFEQSDYKAIRDQLSAIGMTVEDVGYSHATFSESFESIDDFQYVFPIRTYTLFNMITTVEHQYSSYLSEKCDVRLGFYNVEDVDITLTIKSQQNTTFTVDHNGVLSNSKGDTLNVSLQGDLDVHAEYSNFRWFSSITSIIVIIVIAFVLIGLIWIIKKR